MHLYPLLLASVLHPRVWGGRKLATLFAKTLPTDAPYGESWEVYDTSVVMNGAYAGQTLGTLLSEHGAALIGASYDPALGLPLLVKFLDAAQWLSIQVHPNDVQATALENQPRGKTEAWYVLSADPGAQLVIGVQPGTTPQALAAAIEQNTIEALLVYAEVQADDLLYIPAGTIHALGPGLLIYEIQQASDLTYRLYDWGRLGLDGAPRPLHIEKSVQVANLGALPTITHAPDDDGDEATIPLLEGDYFRTLRHTLNGKSMTLDTEGRFHALTCISGAVTVQRGDDGVALRAGQSAFMPAAAGAYTLSGVGRVLNSMQAVQR
ncbi:MAG: class I mannose-6-phosphate isomerase [Armatimonadetes bacterium]|nr:class I mannose-6-phosphate isomerase [Anaerolineae bacterium]